MWRLSFIVLMALSSGRCQYLSQQQVAPSTDGRDTSGWDIRLAVPGEPDRDYPTLSSIPKTGFTCAGKDAGYYADVETRCQVFRVCTIGATYGFQSFLCPNGTLFNQQVFVCDWWMNVNCQGSQRYFNNNDKFGSLKLGPSMMKDIKKMLTYPMSNPYNKNNLNNNQFVMQIYNPPSGQPFSNGGSVENTADNFRNTGFRPSQQLQLPAFQNGINKYNENQFSDSTPSPQYVAANVEQNANFINNAHRLAQLQNERFQNTQNGRYLSSHGNEAGAVFNENNAQFGQLRNHNDNAYLQTYTGQNLNTQNGKFTNGHNSQLTFAQNLQSQYKNAANAQFQNGFMNSQRYQFSNSQNTANELQNSQYNQNTYQNEKQIQPANNFNGQYHEIAKQTSNNGDGQNELEVTVTKQQYTYPSQHDKQYTYKISADQANSLQVGQLQEVKQNLAFVYDFLANSINAAKTYENTLNENTKKFHLATANIFGQQFQNIDAEDLNEISQKISQLTTTQYNNNNNYKSNQYQTANLVSSTPTTTNTENTYRGLNKFSNNQELQTNEQFNQIRSGQLRQSPDINGNFYSSNFYNGNVGNSANLQDNPTNIQNEQLYQTKVVNQNANQQPSSNAAYTNNFNQQNLEINELQRHQNADNANINTSKESNEVELVNTGLQSSDRSAAKLQAAPKDSQETAIFNTANQSTVKTSNRNTIVPNENGIGAQFHKQVVGTINHPKSDKNLITYKADKSFYVYTKYVGSEGNKETTNTGNKQFGELRQSEQHSDAISNVQHSVNNGREVTTVQFIPSLSFELDDSDQRHLDNVVQNLGGSSAAYTANVNRNGFNQRAGSIPSSSVDYSIHRTMMSNDRALHVQNYNQVPANQYAGPSSYSAPQGSIGRLDSQNGQLNVLPSHHSNGYAPARLEEFEEGVTDSGYPKVTPAIPFSF